MKTAEQEIVDKKVTKFMADLAEHHLITGIQFFLTMKVGAESFSMASGTGEWYSRLGHVQDWIWQQQARTKIHIRRLDSEEENGTSPDL